MAAGGETSCYQQLTQLTVNKSNRLILNRKNRRFPFISIPFPFFGFVFFFLKALQFPMVSLPDGHVK